MFKRPNGVVPVYLFRFKLSKRFRSCASVFIVNFEHLNDWWVCLMVTENYLKSLDMHLEVLKTKKIFVPLQETPCFTYQIDKIQENKVNYKKLLKNRKLSLANAGNI